MNYLQIKTQFAQHGTYTTMISDFDTLQKLRRMHSLGFVQEQPKGGLKRHYQATSRLNKILNKPVENPLCIGVKVLLYNRNRKAFMQRQYVIEEIKGEWYGVRGMLGIVWRKASDLKLLA